MTLFRDEPFVEGRCKVRLTYRWGLHWWTVEYSNNLLFDRGGVNRDFEKARQNILKALHRIRDYEEREAKRWSGGYDIR